MNLEQVVPPLELCKLIPKGEFENSALVWAEIKKENEVKSYIYTADMVNYYATSFHKLYPAPTLQEILEEFNFYRIEQECSTPLLDIGDFYAEGENLAKSALMVWLEKKGKI